MRGFRIGRVFGIELRVDWSWIFIFVLLTWNLVSVFSHGTGLVPARSVRPRGIAALLFFGCVLLHELAHSVVAWDYGLHVRSITLFLFGGVSDIEHEPPSPRVEFFMAIVGPITSIMLGLGFLLFASGGTFVLGGGRGRGVECHRAPWGSGPVARLARHHQRHDRLLQPHPWVPARRGKGPEVRPVGSHGRPSSRDTMGFRDRAGHRLALHRWGDRHDLRSHLPFFGTGLVSGIWLAFIGWFLHGAAIQATTRLALDDVLAGMTVEELMQRDVPAAAPDLSVATLVHEHLISGDDRALPVVDGGVLLGLVSVSDVLTLKPEQWAGTPVRAIMHGVEGLSVVTPEEPLAKAFEQLATRDVDQLPVAVEGNLVGMLRRRDVTRWTEVAWRPTASVALKTAGRARSVTSDAPGRGAGGRPIAEQGAHHAA